MQILIAIALAGGAGCVLRFLLSQKIYQLLGQDFPFGIFFVNLLGCFLIGLLSILLLDRYNLPPAWRAGILIGFLGGFTTFSSFTLDTMNLFEQGAHFSAILYVFSSVVFCLLATFMGIYLGRNL